MEIGYLHWRESFWESFSSPTGPKNFWVGLAVIGLNATIGMFRDQLGIPAPLAYLAIAAEFFGGLGLIVGFLARVAAVGVAVTMAVAMVKVHLQHGFFLNWFGDKQGHGFEYHLLALALALVVIVHGAGAFSLDRALYRQVVTPNNAAGMSSVRDVC